MVESMQHICKCKVIIEYINNRNNNYTNNQPKKEYIMMNIVSITKYHCERAGQPNDTL